MACFLIGISGGGFWSLAGGNALRLVPERHIARATAVIFGGVQTASWRDGQLSAGSRHVKSAPSALVRRVIVWRVAWSPTRSGSQAQAM